MLPNKEMRWEVERQVEQGARCLNMVVMWGRLLKEEQGLEKSVSTTPLYLPIVWSCRNHGPAKMALLKFR